MSTLNALLLDGGNALVVVDTNISSGGETTKLFPIAHLGAIAAGRGRPAVLLSVVCGLATVRSFDDAVSNMEALFREARTHVEQWEEGGPPEAKAARAKVSLFGEVDRDELLLVGWSTAAQRVRAAKIKSRPDGGVDMEADLAFSVAPPHPSAASRTARSLASVSASSRLYSASDIERGDAGGQGGRSTGGLRRASHSFHFRYSHAISSQPARVSMGLLLGIGMSHRAQRMRSAR